MSHTVYQIERSPGGKFRSMTKIQVNDKPKAKRRAYLSNWSIISRDNSSKWVQLAGYVYGHPKFVEGTYIETSPILKLDIPGGYAETINTKYMLRDDRVDNED